MHHAPPVKINIISGIKNESKPVKPSLSSALVNLKKEVENGNNEGVLMTVTVTKKEKDVTTTEVSEVNVPTYTYNDNKKQTPGKKKRRVFIRELYNKKTKKYRLDVTTSCPWSTPVVNPKCSKVDAATNTLPSDDLVLIDLDMISGNSGSSLPTTLCNQDLYPNAEFSKEPDPPSLDQAVLTDEQFLIDLLDDDTLLSLEPGVLPLAPAATLVPMEPVLDSGTENVPSAGLFDNDFMISLQSFISDFGKDA